MVTRTVPYWQPPGAFCRVLTLGAIAAACLVLVLWRFVATRIWHALTILAWPAVIAGLLWLAGRFWPKFEHRHRRARNPAEGAAIRPASPSKPSAGRNAVRVFMGAICLILILIALASGGICLLLIARYGFMSSGFEGLFEMISGAVFGASSILAAASGALRQCLRN